MAGDCTDECLERGWPDAVIVGEPSALDVWIAEPGLEHVRVEIEGLATHALNRWRAFSDAPGSEAGGVNAIDKALIVASTVRDLERTWTTEQRHDLLPPGFNTINLGAIVGGKSSGPARSMLRPVRAASRRLRARIQHLVLPASVTALPACGVRGACSRPARVTGG